MNDKNLLNKLILLLCMIVGGVNATWADEVTIDFSKQGYANATDVTSVGIDNTDIIITFDKGTNSSNSPKYYNDGTAIRAYGGNTMTVSSESKIITKVVLTFGTGGNNNEITTNEGTYTNGTWTGYEHTVIFTVDGSTGHRRIQTVTITYKEMLENDIIGIDDSYSIDPSNKLELSATSTSGATVLYEIVPEGTTVPANSYQLENNILFASKRGTIIIRAYTDAFELYKAAEKIITVYVSGDKNELELSINDKDWEVGESYTFTIADFLSDGTTTLSSSNSEIVSVNGSTIKAVAVGTAIIKVDIEEGTDYLAGTGEFTVRVNDMEGTETAPNKLLTTIFAQGKTEDGNPNYSEGIEWSLLPKVTFSFVERGVQVSSAQGLFTLSTKNTEALVKVSLIMSTNNAGGNTVSVKVGDTSFQTTYGGITATDKLTLPKADNMVIEFEGYGTGDVIISINDIAQSVWIKSITLVEHAIGPELTLSTTGYASYCCKYPLDFTEKNENYRAWYVSNVEGTEVTFTEITGKIKGGTPFILYGKPETTCKLSFTNSDNELTDNMLKGTLSPTYIETTTGDGYTNFGLSGGKFMKISPGVMPANKAYLPVLTEIANSNARLSIVFKDDETTGILDHEPATTNNNNHYYNLNGQRVNPTKGGLYIVNGKKVIVK